MNRYRALALALFMFPMLGGPARAADDSVELAASPCVSTMTSLCLLEGRFSARLRWNDGTGFRDAYVAAPTADGSSSSSGLFFFYPMDPSNWEVLVKMVDGCANNSRYWLLVSASTGFGWELTVRDEATGYTRLFTHPLDGQASGISDFGAFSTCGLSPTPAPTPVPTPLPTPPPSSYANVRYLNQLLCYYGFNYGFESTLSANGYVWKSTDLPSNYQRVYRATLGPISETNMTTCLNHFYDVVWPLVYGHRYTVRQFDDYQRGVTLSLVDEGPIPPTGASEVSDPTN